MRFSFSFTENDGEESSDFTETEKAQLLGVLERRSDKRYQSD